MLPPRWFSFLPRSFYSALNHCRAPILFSVCEAFCISVLRLLLRSLSYFFHLPFQEPSLFPICHCLPYNISPFRISFILLIFTLFTYSSPDPSFLLLLVKTAFLHGGRSGKAGWIIFWLWKATNVPIDTSEILQRRVCTILSTYTKFATAVNESLTNPSKSEVYLKRRNSFPQITLSGLPEQAFIFILETLLRALKPL